MAISKRLEEYVYHTPLILLTLKEEKLIELDRYLPYSTGFEIECAGKVDGSAKSFEGIPDIMYVDFNSSAIGYGEQRFRIPNGVRGLICLYNICEQLKVNCELNPDSGIHYHVDMTNCFRDITDGFINNNKEYVLNELDKWGYKGTYNARDCSRNRCWVRYSDEHNTIEFRIGEMSFDYSVLVNRIIHANQIVQQLRINLATMGAMTTSFKPVDKKSILTYMKNVKYEDLNVNKWKKELEKLTNKADGIGISNKTKMDIIKSRVVRL